MVVTKLQSRLHAPRKVRRLSQRTLEAQQRQYHEALSYMFSQGIAQVSRDMLQNDVSHRFRKILVSVKFVSAILGQKWLRQFYGRLEFLPSFCRKTSMSIKFLVLGGGGILGLGGGSADFIFLGAGIFLTDMSA